MYSPQNKTIRHSALTALAGLILSVTLPVSAAMAQPALERHPALDQAVMNTVQQCQQLSRSCAALTRSALGVLVFPNVLKADFIIGGAGGEGALVENGRITGYYSIGGASAGLQAGIENTSQVFVLNTPVALERVKKGPDWKIGASAGVTLVSADANAMGATGTGGDVYAYIFDGKGLHAGVSLDAFDVWSTGQRRP